MKLTKAQRKFHKLAVELIRSIDPGKHRDTMIDCPACQRHDGGCETCDYNSFGQISASEAVFKWWLPGAENDLGIGAIFFTPPSFAISIARAHSGVGRVLEPTAGIGVIANACHQFHRSGNLLPKLTCIEQNAAFVEIGKRMVPEAEWHCGDVRDILPKLPRFDSAIGNPPFGRVPTMNGEAQFEIASLLTKHTKNGGILLLPENSHDRQSTDNDPSSKYISWAEKHPGWRITETEFVGPDRFSACNIKTCICELSKE